MAETMLDVMNGSQVSAPPPMSVTFAEDYPVGCIRLVEESWPARLLVTGHMVDMALRGETRAMKATRGEGLGDPVVLTFDLLNASAVYRQVDLRPETAELWQRDIYEFDCVSCSRDVTDG